MIVSNRLSKCATNTMRPVNSANRNIASILPNKRRIDALRKLPIIEKQ